MNIFCQICQTFPFYCPHSAIFDHDIPSFRRNPNGLLGSQYYISEYFSTLLGSSYLYGHFFSFIVPKFTPDHFYSHFFSIPTLVFTPYHFCWHFFRADEQRYWESSEGIDIFTAHTEGSDYFSKLFHLRTHMTLWIQISFSFLLFLSHLASSQSFFSTLTFPLIILLQNCFPLHFIRLRTFANPFIPHLSSIFVSLVKEFLVFGFVGGNTCTKFYHYLCLASLYCDAFPDAIEIPLFSLFNYKSDIQTLLLAVPFYIFLHPILNFLFL